MSKNAASAGGDLCIRPVVYGRSEWPGVVVGIASGWVVCGGPRRWFQDAEGRQVHPGVNPLAIAVKPAAQAPEIPFPQNLKVAFRPDPAQDP